MHSERWDNPAEKNRPANEVRALLNNDTIARFVRIASYILEFYKNIYRLLFKCMKTAY
jgi:hypothetical protein